MPLFVPQSLRTRSMRRKPAPEPEPTSPVFESSVSTVSTLSTLHSTDVDHFYHDIKDTSTRQQRPESHTQRFGFLPSLRLPKSPRKKRSWCKDSQAKNGEVQSRKHNTSATTSVHHTIPKPIPMEGPAPSHQLRRYFSAPAHIPKPSAINKQSSRPRTLSSRLLPRVSLPCTHIIFHSVLNVLAVPWSPRCIKKPSSQSF
jgi:hypothetical protein